MKPINVAIRADAGPFTGAGHIMRCMAIAEALQQTGARIHFICKELVGELPALIQSAGYQLSMLDYAGKSPREAVDSEQFFSWQGDADACMQLATRLGPIDLLIVDHYQLDHRWQASVRLLTNKILAVDDLANRQHEADILIDHNYGRVAEDYEPLCLPQCKLLLGPKFALLRHEFFELRPKALLRRKHAAQPFKLLLSLGGGDNSRIITRIIELIAKVSRDQVSDLIVVDPNTSAIKPQDLGSSRAGDFNIIHMRHTSGLAELMQEADLAIGAGGVSSLERCALGLPSLVLVLAENQYLSTTRLSKDGHLFDHLTSDELTEERLKNFLSMNREIYQGLSQQCSTVTDGLGVQRVLEALENEF